MSNVTRAFKAGYPDLFDKQLLAECQEHLFQVALKLEQLSNTATVSNYSKRMLSIAITDLQKAKYVVTDAIVSATRADDNNF